MRGLAALIGVFATLILCPTNATARDSLQQKGGPLASSAFIATPGTKPARQPPAGTAPSASSSTSAAASAATTATAAVAGSTAALAPEELKQVEASLLALFGLKRRPRPNRARAIVPEAMMELWRRQQGNRDSRLALPERMARPANTVRSFTHVESDVDATFAGSHRFRLAFDVNSIPAAEALKGAELQLSRRGTSGATSGATDSATTGQAAVVAAAAAADESIEARTEAEAATTAAVAAAALAAAVTSTTSTTTTPAAAVAALPKENSPKSSAGRPPAQRVLVHDVLRPGNRQKGRDPILRLLDSRIVSSAGNASVALDVYPAVQRWREQPRRNYGLLVEVLTDATGGGGGGGGGVAKGAVDASPPPHVRLRRDVGEHDASWLPVQPVLIAYTDDGKSSSASGSSRSRRAAPAKKHHKVGKRDHCRRYPLYVDFADVGWNDWIVAPPGYEAFYCHGDCPFPLSDHLNSTNHAIVQTLMHSVKPTVPQACCVPTALTSISMLYLDETDKVVLKNYQEMAVVGCGCR